MDTFIGIHILIAVFAIVSVARHPGRYFRSRLFWFFFFITLPNLGVYF